MSPGTMIAMPAERAILHVDMDAFFSSIAQLDDPSLRDKPVLTGGTGPGPGAVGSDAHERLYAARHAASMSIGKLTAVLAGRAMPSAAGSGFAHLLRLFLIVLVALCSAGCFAARYADYTLPGARFDRAGNRPLPDRDDPAVAAAFADWRDANAVQRRQRPTPYHWYVNSPMPGTFEGDAPIGLAFSGGGTRGILFAAACLRELESLGPIHVEGPDGNRRIDLLTELDYVSAVSTGAIPAALFVLDTVGRAPEGLGRDHWPDALNQAPVRRSLIRTLFRPDRVLRDLIFEMNTRPAFAATLAEVYFDGHPYRRRSGLRFGDLPPTPVLIVGAVMLNQPGSVFIQSRLPYRHFLGNDSPVPWLDGAQSFESFGSDPMAYPLGEASYNSLAFPGFVRSGLIAVRSDPAWVAAELPADQQVRMERARDQSGHENTYGLVDGGLADNRGIDYLAALFQTISQRQPEMGQPLIIALDAGMIDMAPIEPGRRFLHRSWMGDVGEASRVAWTIGQRTINAWVESQAAAGQFDLALFRYAAWHSHVPVNEAGANPHSAEYRKLAALCREEPLIGDPQTLLAVSRGIGPHFGRLDAPQVAAIRIAARFTVWESRDDLLAWAEAVYGGTAQFESKASPAPQEKRTGFDPASSE